MTKSLSLRLTDQEFASLEAKAKDLGVSHSELIKDALEAYGALAPDEGFNLKLRAHLRDILGFSSPESLEDFILGIVEANVQAQLQPAQEAPKQTENPVKKGPRRPSIAGDTEKLITEMHQANKTLREISEATGYPISSVSSFISRQKD